MSAAAIQNVVIIGLGSSGVHVAKQLDKSLPSNYRIIAIHETDYGFYPIASLRASVVPGWEDKPVAALDKVFPASSRHVILSGVQVLELGDNFVKVDSDNGTGLGHQIDFAFAVLATGSTYPSPCRPPIGAKTIQQAIDSFKNLQKAVANAKSVLIVGAGATGIEYAGEVAAHHPGKKVALVSRTSSLLVSYKEKLGKSLESQMTKLGVKLYFDTSINTSDFETGPIPSTSFKMSNGETIQADFIMLAYGATPNSSLVSKLDATAVDENGHVKVSPTLQIIGHEKIFAVGDVTDVKESKQFVNAQNQVPVVAANLTALALKKETPKRYKAGPQLILVTGGPSGGAGQMFGWVVGAFLTGKIKSSGLFLSGFKGLYNQTV